MLNIKDKFESAKDRVVGKTKQGVGMFGDTKEKITRKISNTLNKKEEDNLK